MAKDIGKTVKAKDQKEAIRNFVEKNRILVLIACVLIAVLIIYFMFGSPFQQSGPLNQFKTDCNTACAAAQQSGSQPIAFCNYATAIDNVTYTCTSVGLTCDVNGYVYNTSRCQGENPYQAVIP